MELKKYFVSFFLFNSFALYAQSSINAEYELLCKIPVSQSTTEVSIILQSNDYESLKPFGPFIDGQGDITFYQYNGKILKIERNSIKQEDSDKELFNNLNFISSSSTLSNNGIVLTSKMQLYKNGKIMEFPESNDYPTKYIVFNKGILFNTDNKENLFLYTINYDSIELQVEDKVYEWLDDNKYSLKNENFYYDKKLLANISKSWFDSDEIYGRLKSKHMIHPIGSNWKPTSFIINSVNGDEQLKIVLNYPQEKTTDNFIVNWGIGNYGEIYMLLGPVLKEYSNNYYPTEGDAELVVIRNHLKYFGILNDNNIRLRKGPGTDTESLGTYPVKTGFRILEDSGVKQTIDGQTYTWIKVRLLDGTEGYFYGQYVQNLYDGPGTPLPWPNVADWD